MGHHSQEHHTGDDHDRPQNRGGKHHAGAKRRASAKPLHAQEAVLERPEIITIRSSPGNMCAASGRPVIYLRAYRTSSFSQHLVQVE